MTKKQQIWGVCAFAIVAIGILGLWADISQRMNESEQNETVVKRKISHVDSSKVIDVGLQPTAIIRIEALFHDRILQKQLMAEGWTLKGHPFRNGSEMLPYADQQLDVMVIGDLPSLIAMSKSPVGIVALCKQGYNTMITRKRDLVTDLRGKRIGYTPLTTGHFALIRTLNASHIPIEDVELITMTPDQMENAMIEGRVDAVVSWEPVASQILSHAEFHRVSYSDGFSFVAVNLNWAKTYPRIYQYLLAAVLRSISYLRESDAHIKEYLRWDRDAAMRYYGKSPLDTTENWVALAHRETIDNPSFPLLPLSIQDSSGILQEQFSYLKQQRLIADSVRWGDISKKILMNEASAIVVSSEHESTLKWDYSKETLYP